MMRLSAARTTMSHTPSLKPTPFYQSHLGLVLTMVCITLLWSTAGVINRQVVRAQGWDTTFWRAAFTAVFTAAYWWFSRGSAGILQDLRAGRLLWASAVCWAVMFTCFMLAMSYTTVGHVLLTMSVGPFLTALLARLFMGQRILPHTWWAVLLAGSGLVYMFGSDLAHSEGRALTGVLIAFCVPIAGAINFLMLQHSATRKTKVTINLMPAVCLGACISALLCLPAMSFATANAVDLAWLASLGLFQLAIPCVWMVWVSARLPATEVSLLQVLEIIFGTTWAWLWGRETPSNATLIGGSVVVVVLVVHAAWGIRVNKTNTKL
jgi:drug/metabolite transporter (DMT)-like permease